MRVETVRLMAISVSSGLELLQIVSEPDNEWCANEGNKSIPYKGVETSP